MSKNRHFREADKAQVAEVWEMHDEEIRAIRDQVLTADNLLHSHVLGWEWAAPPPPSTKRPLGACLACRRSGALAKLTALSELGQTWRDRWTVQTARRGHGPYVRTLQQRSLLATRTAHRCPRPCRTRRLRGTAAPRAPPRLRAGAAPPALWRRWTLRSRRCSPSRFSGWWTCCRSPPASSSTRRRSSSWRPWTRRMPVWPAPTLCWRRWAWSRGRSWKRSCPTFSQAPVRALQP